MYRLVILVIVAATFSCKPGQTQWHPNRVIDLGRASPIGLTFSEDKVWLADGDNNKLIAIDRSGKQLESKSGFERPMHIDAEGNKLYVPEYGKDQITIISPQGSSALKLNEKLDAPAGVDVSNGQVAIADFYNHRVLYTLGTDWKSLGKKGKASGEFHYPTDVQWAGDRLYVADAYNNRVQVFDREGIHLLTIGQAEQMNASTGIFVSDDQLFVTDFENNRLLIYDLKGALQQIIAEGLEKPTDVLLIDEELWVTNYKGNSISVFSSLRP